MPKTEISIVLGTYNRRRFLEATIDNIRKHSITVPYEIIVVDGGSTDGTLQWLSRQKDIITIIQHNRGKFRGNQIERRSWGYFMNLAFKIAQGKYALMLSDDCLLVPNSVMNGYKQFEDMLHEGNQVGALAFYWRNWPLEKRYFIITLFDAEIPMVNHGMFLMDALQEIDWIDEEAFMFYSADSDLACRLKEAGYSIEICEKAYVEHRAHVNTSARNANAKYTEEDFEVFYDRWEGIYYNKEGSKGQLNYKEFFDPTETYKQFPKNNWIDQIKEKKYLLERYLYNKIKGNK
ncbi:MAG: glycosyltransferase [Anaerolineaceae bacterium]|nr:glycosyltransferase [Anaerolineaceae bacterium]